METADIARPAYTDPSEAETAMLAAGRARDLDAYLAAAAAYFELIDVKVLRRRAAEDLDAEFSRLTRTRESPGGDSELVDLLAAPGEPSDADVEAALRYARGFIEQEAGFGRKDPRRPRVEAFFARAEEFRAAGDAYGARWAIREALRASA